MWTLKSGAILLCQARMRNLTKLQTESDKSSLDAIASHFASVGAPSMSVQFPFKTKKIGSEGKDQ